MGFVSEVKGQASPPAFPLGASLHYRIINRTRARILKDDDRVAIVETLQPWEIFMWIFLGGAILVRILDI